MTGRRARFLSLFLGLWLLICMGAQAFAASDGTSGEDGGVSSGDTSGDTGGNVIPDDAIAQDRDESEPPDLSGAKCAVLYNLDSHFLMHDYHGSDALYPASTVKLMTALTAWDYLSERLDETVTVPKEVIRDTVGISMELRTGEVLTVRQLFAGLLIAGAGDAAYTLALESCGSVEVFVAKMNEKAKAIGMKNTVYRNVTGVDDVSAHTTGRDVITLAAKVYENELFRELTAEPIYEMPATNEHAARTLHTRNYMLSKRIYPYYYAPDASGMNAGATTKGGNCLVAVETIGNVRYLCVVMGAGERPGEYAGEQVSLNESYLLCRELFDWGSRTFEYRTIVAPMYVYGEIPVLLSGGSDYVTAVPTDIVQIFLPKDSDTADYASILPTLTVQELTAPVSEGTEVGEVTVYDKEGNEIGSTKLVTKSSINLSQWRFIGAKILEVVRRKAFQNCVIAFFAVCFLGVLITARVRYVRGRRAALRAEGREDGSE